MILAQVWIASSDWRGNSESEVSLTMKETVVQMKHMSHVGSAQHTRVTGLAWVSHRMYRGITYLGSTRRRSSIDSAFVHPHCEPATFHIPIAKPYCGLCPRNDFWATHADEALQSHCAFPLICSPSATFASSFATASGLLFGAPFVSALSLAIGLPGSFVFDRLGLNGTGVDGRELRNYFTHRQRKHQERMRGMCSEEERNSRY